MKKCNCPMCGKELEVFIKYKIRFGTEYRDLNRFKCNDCGVMMSVFTPVIDESDVPLAQRYDPVQRAYDILTDIANESDDSMSIEEAIGYLGEALAD